MIVVMAAVDAADDEISAAALAQLQAWLQQRPTWKHKPRLARRARRSASTPPAQQRRVFFDAAAGDDDERWGAASDGDDDGLAVEDEAKRYAASLMLPAQLDLFCEKNKLSALRRTRRLSNRSYREEMAPLRVFGAIRPTPSRAAGQTGPRVRHALRPHGERHRGPAPSPRTSAGPGIPARNRTIRARPGTNGGVGLKRGGAYVEAWLKAGCCGLGPGRPGAVARLRPRARPVCAHHVSTAPVTPRARPRCGA